MAPGDDREMHIARARRAGVTPTLKDSALWPNPKKGPWVVTLWFAEVGGRLECVGLDLRSFTTDDAGRPRGSFDRDLTPLTATTLRDVPVGALVDRALESFAAHLLETIERGTGAESLAASKRAAQVAATPKKDRPGRRPELSPDHFRAVAKVYREAFEAGLNNPTALVAQWGQVSKSAAAKWVARARGMGLLPPTSRGKAAGAAPGPKGKAKR